MSTYKRYLRVALSTFTPLPPIHDALSGIEHTLRAQQKLQGVIELGLRPPVVLTTPERATIDTTTAGQVREVYAWRDQDRDPRQQNIVDGQGRCCAVTLTIESDHAEPDPISAEWASAGSHLIHAGHVTTATIEPWLEPIADQIAQIIGAPVRLGDGPAARQVVEPAPPVMIPQALTADECADLIDLHRASDSRSNGPGAPNMVQLANHSGWSELVWRHSERLSGHFDLPLQGVHAFILEYTPGMSQDWHRDNNPEIDPHSARRSVSWSAFLNEPGTDYTGCTLETEFGTFPEIHRGDLIGFTATTTHRVTPLATGTRYALIGFAEWG